MYMYKKKIQEISEIGLPILLHETQSQLKVQEKESVDLIDTHKYVKIPIMGLFNAGKTSLVNALVGHNNLLPVDIIPTTAIPCEIYAVSDSVLQHAEVFRKGQLIYNGPIEGYGSVDIIPGDLGRIFIDSPFTKACQEHGIILVDMPGSDSGIREHNEAIVRYIKDGTVFALISNVCNGSLSSVEIAFLNELEQYGLPCALFLSKTDLKSEEDVSEVMSVYSDQFHRIMGKTSFVGTVCAASNDVESFVKWIDSLDIDEIRRNRDIPVVRKYLDEVIAAVSTYRDLLTPDIHIDDIGRQIAELEKQLADLNKSMNDSINEADSPEKSTQDILDAVRNEMARQRRLVAESILTENSAQVNDTIMSIIRPALLKALKEEREQFVTAMKAELDAVTNRILENIDIHNDAIIDLISENSDEIISSLQLLADRLMKSDNQFANLLGLIINIVAEYIPDFLRQIFGGQEKAIRKIEQKFMGTFTSQVLESLRPIVREQVQEQQKQILENVRIKYEQKIAQIKEALKYLKEERDAGVSNFNGQLQEIDCVLAKLNDIHKSL